MGEQNNKLKKHIDESDVFTRRMFIKGMATSFGALPVFAWPRWAQAFYYNLGFFKKGQSSATYVEDVFSTYLYTGNNTSQTITNDVDLAGKGGLVWLKDRTVARPHGVVDTVRGSGKYLTTSGDGASYYGNSAQITDVASFTGFTSTGFTLGADNTYGFSNVNGEKYSSWTFRKAAKFFDEVTYTGDGTGMKTINHSLGVTPGMVIIKRTDAASDWVVWHRSLTLTGNTQGLKLNATDAFGTPAGGGAVWYTTAPMTSTTISVGSSQAGDWNTNLSGASYVAYLYAHDTSTDGLIQCGSYTGSGGVDSVTLGWEPQFVLMKSTSVTGQWSIEDVMRDMNHSAQKQTQPNSSGAELSQSAYVIPNATGFTVNSGYYGTGATVVYVAIRRPMKTPTDATKVFSIVNGGPLVDGLFGMTTSFAADFWLWKDKTTTAGWYLSDRLRGTPFFNTASNSAESTLGTAWDSNTNIRLTGNNTVPTNFIQYAFRRAPGFFDQVCYTGDGTGPKLYNHNLKVLPDLVILRSRSTGNWCVGVRGLTGGLNNNVALNLTNAVGTNFGTESSAFSIQDTTTTGFNVYAGLNASGTNYTAYLFASCPGVSKVGSYTGNGSNQTINCGFSNGARFIMIKRTDSAGDWYVWDAVRGISGAAPATGETVFSTPGTYNWIVPAGVTSVSVVCVGGGGGGGNGDGSGGGGGALGYKNNIAVTPGTSITVTVGSGGTNATSGGATSFGAYLTANGGAGSQTYSGNAGGTNVNADGGGAGGSANSTSGAGAYGGGGGAGGYSGVGGTGGNNGGSGSNGSGGGGGGGGGFSSGGGGVGLYGVGSNGVGSTGYNTVATGGSGGGNALGAGANDTTSANAGNYGGGGGAKSGAKGGDGACRIMWGAGKSFPSAAGSSTVYNVNDPHLSLNSSSAEVATDNSVDAASSGFTVIQDAATNINVNGATYIFMAIA